MFRSTGGTIQTGCGVNFLIRHCQQCHVCFDCLVYYNSESSLTKTHCTLYEAHYHNGLKLTILDEDLSQAQLAQLDEFLGFGLFLFSFYFFMCRMKTNKRI